MRRHLGRHRPGDPQRALGRPVRPARARPVATGRRGHCSSSVAPTSRARGSRCCWTPRRPLLGGARPAAGGRGPRRRRPGARPRAPGAAARSARAGRRARRRRRRHPGGAARRVPTSTSHRTRAVRASAWSWPRRWRPAPWWPPVTCRRSCRCCAAAAPVRSSAPVTPQTCARPCWRCCDDPAGARRSRPGRRGTYAASTGRWSSRGARRLRRRAGRPRAARSGRRTFRPDGSRAPYDGGQSLIPSAPRGSTVTSTPPVQQLPLDRRRAPPSAPRGSSAAWPRCSRAASSWTSSPPSRPRSPRTPVRSP